MNTIASFRKCTLSDVDLINRIDKLTDEMYTTGKIPSRYVPARPDDDYDLLIGELLIRCKEKILSEEVSPGALKAGVFCSTRKTCVFQSTMVMACTFDDKCNKQKLSLG